VNLHGKRAAHEPHPDGGRDMIDNRIHTHLQQVNNRTVLGTILNIAIGQGAFLVFFGGEVDNNVSSTSSHWPHIVQPRE